MTEYFPTPPCTECRHYNRCRSRFESIAINAGKTTDNIESMMNSRVGVCDEFEEAK